MIFKAHMHLIPWDPLCWSRKMYQKIQTRIMKTRSDRKFYVYKFEHISGLLFGNDSQFV